MLNINEVKSWAKKHGVTVKKNGECYVWFAEGENPSEPSNINEVARQIFNRITDEKWTEYQQEWIKYR